MADSPVILIKVDNMTYVQQGQPCYNQHQKLTNNSPQGTAVNNFPLTAEQAVRDLQMKGYFAEIQKTVDEEHYVSLDELVETPQHMYLSLVKSKQKFNTTTKTIYSYDR